MLDKERLNNLSDDIWKGAIKLRGKFKAKDYPLVILPMIMIRRIECVLEVKRALFRQDILKKTPDISLENLDMRVGLMEASLPFYNTSRWTLKKILKESSTQVYSHFSDYLSKFSPNLGEIIEKFNYHAVVKQVDKANRLDSIIELVVDKDFSPERISNIEMGYVYEELLQRFSQDDAKDTGEHFTPREIIRIMVDLMEIDFDPATSTKSISIYDPACGTGGMLSVAKEHLMDKAKTPYEQQQVATLVLLNGQELLDQNYAVCKADMIIKGEADAKITSGNSLIPHLASVSDDGDRHAGYQFDYMISNPPFGVNWSEYKDDALRLATSRYKWGTPDVGDGALLFLLTMIEKMKPAKDGGSKIAVLFNGSPLSNGDALQGESEIRRHILQNDLLDTIVMMPDQMFYNTGIYTYIWLLNNNKPQHKRGKVLILNARDQFEKEPKSFGNKRNRITEQHREWIDAQFAAWQANAACKVFKTSEFAFHKVKVVFWQTDEHAQPMWITEAFDVQLNNGNVQKRFELYGDMTLYVTVDVMLYEEMFYREILPVEMELHYDGSTAFDELVMREVKDCHVSFEIVANKSIKKALKNWKMTATYRHRHYIVDNEYIPFDDAADDKAAYIKAFLAREIEHPIISWEEYAQLGYEILPNKYFYQYQEPTPSDQLIEQFWALEKQAEQLLQDIKEL